MITSALSSQYPIKWKNPHWEIRPSSSHFIDRLVDLGFRRESILQPTSFWIKTGAGWSILSRYDFHTPPVDL